MAEDPSNRQRPRDQGSSNDPPRRPTGYADLGFTPRKPVQWFSPSVLGRSGLRVAITAAFGDYLDKRELQASIPAAPLTHHKDDGEIWIDYIADTGDGFDPTYTVAWLAAQESLDVAGAGALPRSKVTVFGGDEVYPVGGVEEYENRFVGPLEAAMPWQASGNSEMYLLAGNHDWYDGLTSFSRYFCQGNWVGARHTRQRRSYFALQLPHGWWLWGFDIQFETFIDEPQIEYFEEAVKLMAPGDRVILCTPVPTWTHVVAKSGAFAKLGYIEEHLVDPSGARLMLTLSGDSHHYAHYAGPDGTHKVTAGGGGAFLHGTHDLPGYVDLRLDKDPTSPSQRFDLHEHYPDAATSKKLAYGAVGLPLHSPTFVVVPALFFLLAGWSMEFGLRVFPGRLSRLDSKSAPFRWADGFVGLGRNPLSVVLLLVLFALLFGFAKPPDRWAHGGTKDLCKLAMALAHVGLYVVALNSTMWAAVHLGRHAGLHGAWFTFLLLVLVAVGGAVLGSLATAVYLALTCAWLDTHVNDAFSAMSLTSYKNFLRLHIDREGVLHVYPLGVDRAHGSWAFDPGKGPEAPWMTPVGGVPVARLLHTPITIDGRTP